MTLRQIVTTPKLVRIPRTIKVLPNPRIFPIRISLNSANKGIPRIIHNLLMVRVSLLKLTICSVLKVRLNIKPEIWTSKSLRKKRKFSLILLNWTRDNPEYIVTTSLNSCPSILKRRNLRRTLKSMNKRLQVVMTRMLLQSISMQLPWIWMPRESPLNRMVKVLAIPIWERLLSWLPLRRLILSLLTKTTIEARSLPLLCLRVRMSMRQSFMLKSMMILTIRQVLTNQLLWRRTKSNASLILSLCSSWWQIQMRMTLHWFQASWFNPYLKVKLNSKFPLRRRKKKQRTKNSMNAMSMKALETKFLLTLRKRMSFLHWSHLLTKRRLIPNLARNQSGSMRILESLIPSSHIHPQINCI